MDQRRVMNSGYLIWAKTETHARFNLATSGVANLSLRELPIELDDLEISGPSFYGYEPLIRLLAARYEVAPENVITAAGASMANHLAMAVSIEPGDEVLIERPTYEPLIATALYLGARVKRFERRAEKGFAIEPEEVERSMSARTRLIVMTNLHNPTSALTDVQTLKEIGRLARRVGARVLIDEVYLETAFEDAPKPAFHLGPEFISTNSLTKTYGLSGLRCGWALADADLVRKMWLLHDLYGVIMAHPAERLSVVALKNIESISRRAKDLLARNRALLESFFDSRGDLEPFRVPYGTTIFPRLRSGRVDDLCRLLRDKYETAVVPGEFFGVEDRFRIGIGCDTQTLAAGLERLGAALDELATRN